MYSIICYSKSTKTMHRSLQASLYFPIRHISKKIASIVDLSGIKLNWLSNIVVSYLNPYPITFSQSFIVRPRHVMYKLTLSKFQKPHFEIKAPQFLSHRNRFFFLLKKNAYKFWCLIGPTRHKDDRPKTKVQNSYHSDKILVSNNKNKIKKILKNSDMWWNLLKPLLHHKAQELLICRPQ